MIVHQRIRNVLAAMAQVSEADGQSVVLFDPNTSHESNAPTGVRTGMALRTMNPNQPRTLLDEWSQIFHDHANGDARELECLVEVAEAALAAYTHRLPVSLSDEHADPTESTERRCLVFYEGMSAERAAAIEARVYGGHAVSLTRWLERLRVRNDRDPRTGLTRPTGEGRLRRVAELRAQGLGARRIARELGCAVSTAQAAIRDVENNKEAA